MKKGFSLIEVLIVIAIFSIIALVISQTLFTILKGSAKQEVSATIKQEGNYIIAAMERAIHNSKSITACGSGRIDYMDADARPGSFVCDTTAGTVASGSATPIVITGTRVSVTGCSFTCLPAVPPYKSVDVNLTFQARDTAGTLRAEEKSRVQLRTKILLRN
ncbi:MAG: type II secretion system protein [bacterium]|nr:type II secretion system protein [bacterium]